MESSFKKLYFQPLTSHGRGCASPTEGKGLKGNLVNNIQDLNSGI